MGDIIGRFIFVGVGSPEGAGIGAALTLAPVSRVRLLEEGESMRNACLRRGDLVSPKRGLVGCGCSPALLATLGLASRDDDETPRAAPASAAIRDEILDGLTGRLLGEAGAVTVGVLLPVAILDAGTGERGLAGEFVADVVADWGTGTLE